MRSFQTPTIEEDLPNDGVPTQARSAIPQSPPSIVPMFGTQATTSKTPRTRAANLVNVSSKVMGRKKCRLNGDMATDWKKFADASEKIENLKLELQREAIEITKSIAQSMIEMEERSKQESREQIL